MTTSDYWIKGFRLFFCAVEESLPEVLAGAGCREGWLQGEALRFFRRRGDHFHVNCAPLAKRKTADFAAYAGDQDNAELRMLGEIKIFGVSGYQEKILGVAVAPLVKRLDAGERRLLLSTDMALASSRWTLLHDYARLRGYSAPEPLTKLLILVLDTRAAKPDRFGRVLHAVDFNPGAVELHATSHFIARGWIVE